ncbi:polysaccharide pyruvyl transferase family protein [Mucisphaera sp.]|uniref:polysaccharide pyruvyl transferase family protein n=1 Tax=Mucisphaera sp. TaxID=2913024 RepID=UPI003D119FE4
MTLKYGYKKSGYHNFGDYLAEYYYKNFISRTKHELNRSYIYLIGSVIHEEYMQDAYRRGVPIHYWSCGARKSTDISRMLLDICTFHGVRGPLTSAVLGGDVEVVGDSALLLPLLYSPRVSNNYLNKKLFIPHLNTPCNESVLSSTGCDLIMSPSIQGSSRSVELWIDRVASSKFILSASLHGAIVAYAYGVPFAFYSKGHIDCPFKWHDFSAYLGVTASFVDSVERGERWYLNSKIEDIKKQVARLIDTCPYEFTESLGLRSASGSVYV